MARFPEIPGYKLTARLGEGSFGEVFRAEKDGIPYAIKVYKHRFDPVKGLPISFQREFEITRQWNHPNLVRSVECGSIPSDDSRHIPCQLRPAQRSRWSPGTAGVGVHVLRRAE